MGGFHPERAVARWRDRVRQPGAPREELAGYCDAIMAMTAFMERRGDAAPADELRQRATETLRSLFDEYAAELEAELTGRTAP